MVLVMVIWRGERGSNAAFYFSGYTARVTDALGQLIFRLVHNTLQWGAKRTSDMPPVTTEIS